MRLFAAFSPQISFVMIPIQLSLRNFMCYRADSSGAPLSLDLDGTHVVCLSGENGSGKSALLDAITWALWGEGRVPDDEMIAQGESEMQVDLTFALGDQRYRVIRQRQRGGTGKRGGQTPGKSQLDLQIADGAGWRPIGEGGIRETQAQINALLRMSYDTFINASFLLQGRADEFTAKMPAERKKVLADILDLGEYDELERQARERAKGHAQQLAGLRGKIEQLAESAGKLGFWRAEVESAESRVAAATARAEAAAEEHSRAEDRARKLEEQARQRQELQARLAELRHEQEALEQRIADLRAKVATSEALLSQGAEIAAGVAELQATRDELERLDGLRDQFHALESRRKELQAELKEALAELRAKHQAAANRRDSLRDRATRHAQIEDELAGLAAQLQALAPLNAEREARATERDSLALRLARIDELERRRAELTALIEKRQDSLVAAREELGRTVRRLDEQLKEAPGWEANLAAARDAASRLTEAEAALAAARARERADLDEAGTLRAACERLKADADKLKADQALLDSGGGTCPICRSDLGAGGVERVHAHYAAELAELRTRYAAAKKGADAAEARLAETRAAIADIEGGLSTLMRSAASVDALARQMEQAAGWRAERDQLAAKHDELAAMIAARDFEPAAQAELAELAGLLADLGDPADLRQQHAMLEERLRELDTHLRERARLEGAREARAAEAARLTVDLADLPAAEAEAQELERRLAENDFAPEIRQEGRQVMAAIESLGYSDEAHAAARARAKGLEHWEQKRRDLELAERDLANQRLLLERDAALHAKTAAEIERLTREDALLEQELRRLPQARAERDAAAKLASEARDALQSAQNDRAEKLALLRRAEADAQDLERQRAEERRLSERQELFAELAEALGKKGVQAMLIETAIPQIEEEANRLLGRMTDNQMHLSFEMQRDTKKGDTVETLDIKIADTLGTRAYDAFSGGEAMRANFAVRVALSRLLARRAGARLETLVIDEGFGSLDALGRERMVEAITSVQDDFRRIIVITHIDDLKDRFPALIEVAKTPHGSRWELR